MYRQYLRKPVTALTLLPRILNSFINGKAKNETKEEIVNDLIDFLKRSQMDNDMDDTGYTPWNVNTKSYVKYVADTLFDNNLNFIHDNVITFFNSSFFKQELPDDIIKTVEKLNDILNVDDKFYKIIKIDTVKIQRYIFRKSEIIAQLYEADAKKTTINIMNRIIKAKDPEMKFPIISNEQAAKAVQNAVLKIINSIMVNKIDKEAAEIATFYNKMLIHNLVENIEHSFSEKQQQYLRKHTDLFEFTFCCMAYKSLAKYETENLDYFINKEVEKIKNS